MKVSKKEYIRDKAVIKAFGKRLRLFRKKAGLSMEDLAHQSDMDYSQIGRIERGKINTSLSVASALAIALNIPMKELCDIPLPKKKKKSVK